MFSNIICFMAGIMVYHILHSMNEQEHDNSILASVGVQEPKIPVKPKKKNAKVQGDSSASV